MTAKTDSKHSFHRQDYFKINHMNTNTQFASQGGFHQTTAMSAEQLRQAVESCKRQEQRIELIFQNAPGEYTSHGILKIWNQQGWPEVPITSIRRALTNLHKGKRKKGSNEWEVRPILQKCEEMVQGPWGRPSHPYRLKEDAYDLQGDLRRAMASTGEQMELGI